jgi:hypothetical protein
MGVLGAGLEHRLPKQIAVLDALLQRRRFDEIDIGWPNQRQLVTRLPADPALMSPGQTELDVGRFLRTVQHCLLASGAAAGESLELFGSIIAGREVFQMEEDVIPGKHRQLREISRTVE